MANRWQKSVSTFNGKQEFTILKRIGRSDEFEQLGGYFYDHDEVVNFIKMLNERNVRSINAAYKLGKEQGLIK